MSKSAWFWIIYVVLVLFGMGWTYRDANLRPHWPVSLVILILIGILGWGIFGAPMH